MSATPTVSIADVGRGDVAIAGGKGANLGELLRAGIPVPPAFIVTTQAYEAYLAEARLGEKLAAIFGEVDPDDRAALEVNSERARTLVRDHDTSPSCRDEVLRAYEELGGGLVAVRSSATAEDLDGASGAGQQSTYLNVEGGERVMDAVRACWASLFEPRAVAYRVRCGVSPLGAAIAVAVQRMVPSTRSGVAFSCDPVSHSGTEIVIEAVRGLGEALVSGHVTPDMYVVHKPTLTVLERTVVEQRQELVHTGGAGIETNGWRDLPVVQRTRPKLTDSEIVRLAAIVRRVEEHYGRPQDIEWAEHDGAFFILQSRPVTTLAHAQT